MTEFPDNAMDPSQHPDDQVIQDYLKAPDAAGYQDLRLHLASCAYCRQRVETTALLLAQGHWLESTPAASDPRVDDLIDGRLDTGEAAALRESIKQDPAQLRAALHQASHAHAMRGLRAATGAAASPLRQLLQKAGSWLYIEAPLWKTVPAMALVMGLALFLLQPLQQGETTRLIAFSDQAEVYFVGHETQPGIGFFSQQNAVAEPFAGMQIEIVGPRRLRFAWPEIDAASGYNLKLQVFRDGEIRVLAREEIDRNATELLLSEDLTQHRYEWVLSGDTVDKRSFQVKGGFVVTE